MGSEILYVLDAVVVVVAVVVVAVVVVVVPIFWRLAAVSEPLIAGSRDDEDPPQS